MIAESSPPYPKAKQTRYDNQYQQRHKDNNQLPATDIRQEQRDVEQKLHIYSVSYDHSEVK